MYLSALLIDVGDNPDRPRPGRLWLRNPYRVHQRLCMAFPGAERRAEDPQFLQPYRPEQFTAAVHVPRDETAGFLFRVDPLGAGRVMVLVQSGAPPDWEYAFHNAAHLLVAPPAVRPFEPAFTPSQRLRFRLRANPTQKRSFDSGKKRVGLYGEEAQRAWLQRKATEGGFAVTACDLTADGCRTARRGGGDEAVRMPLLAVRFDGALQVQDPERFTKTLRHGLGSAKAFGFGLLSVATMG